MELKDYIGRDVEATLMIDDVSERVVGRVVEGIRHHDTMIFLRHNHPNDIWYGSRPDDCVGDGYRYWLLNSVFTSRVWYKDMVLLGIEPKRFLNKHKMTQ